LFIYDIIVCLRKFRRMIKLTIPEEEAMKVVWQMGEANLKKILEDMPAPVPPYTTLASTIKNLEKKKYITSKLVGNTYFYSPAISEDQYKKQFVSGLVKDYFDNSYKDLVTFFAKQKKISQSELKEILKMIEK